MRKPVLGKTYSREDIHNMLGGEIQSYLPSKDGQIVAGCFTLELNPQAPLKVYPGAGPKIVKRAVQAATAKPELPIFIKRDSREYEYIGVYRPVAFHQDAEHRRAASAETGRNDISGVLEFEPVTKL